MSRRADAVASTVDRYFGCAPVRINHRGTETQSCTRRRAAGVAGRPPAPDERQKRKLFSKDACLRFWRSFGAAPPQSGGLRRVGICCVRSDLGVSVSRWWLRRAQLQRDDRSRSLQVRLTSRSLRLKCGYDGSGAAARVSRLRGTTAVYTQPWRDLRPAPPLEPASSPETADDAP